MVILACAIAFAAGCFTDRGPDQQCADTGCATSTGSTSTVTSSTGETPTTSGAASTTGAPLDPGITLRVDTMSFIDPHLFISEAGSDPGETTGTGTSGGSTGGSTGGDPELVSCVNDVTVLVNGVLNNDIADAKFNLLAHFADFGVVQEMRLLDAECDDPPEGGGRRLCTRNTATPAVILDTEIVLTPGCRQVDTSVYAAVNLPAINDPPPPCLRTMAASFSLPVSDAVGSLNLLEAQMVSTLDSTTSPTLLMNGVLTGFLPMKAAQDLELEAPLFGLVNLWSVLEAAPCVMKYPELLPSVDYFESDGDKVPGVWLAINFTAEQVDYVP